MKPPVPAGASLEDIVRQPQHLNALERANRIKVARARAKNDLNVGLITIAEAFELDEFQTATITSVLECLPRWGHVRAEKACRQVPCSSYRRVGELTARQRALLVRLVAGENQSISNAA
jgi:hypothetical protein